MQILLGLSRMGDVQHTEVLAALSPLQMLSLARARLGQFTRVEIWEETVCVLRLPPAPPRLERPVMREGMTATRSGFTKQGA